MHSLPVIISLRYSCRHFKFCKTNSIGLIYKFGKPDFTPIRSFQSALNSANDKTEGYDFKKWEAWANDDLTDPNRQAAFYKYLIRKHPEAIVNRYEHPLISRNNDCDRLYHQAKAFIVRRSSLTSSDVKLPSQLRSSAEVFRESEPVRVIVEESSGTRALRVLRALLTAGVGVYLVLYGIETFAESSGLKKVWSNSKIEEILPDPSAVVKFSDVCGVDEAKDELEETVQFLKNPKKYTALGGKLPKGILLTGPPGTGKTMLAKAVAGEANVPFFVMSGSQFDEVFVGVGAKRIRDLFAVARAKGPSIIFIDELDAIGQKRNAKEAAHARQTLNQLLVELDGFNTSAENPTVFIAATNFPESLDSALTRPGRFDRHIHVPLPDVRGRASILKHHITSIIVDPEVDINLIARATPGFSGADLANLVNQAAVKGSREGVDSVSMHQFDWAKDKIMMGAERRSHFVTEENKLMTAYHEGGHALVALLTEGANKPYKATIMPRGSSLGMTITLPEMDKDNYCFKEYLAQIDVAMGGRVAEELVYGKDSVTGGAHSDIKNATMLARSLVSELGFSEKIGPVSHDDSENISPETRTLIEQEIKVIVEASIKRVLKLLTEKRKELDRLAKALVEYEYLNQDEISLAIQGKAVQREHFN